MSFFSQSLVSGWDQDPDLKLMTFAFINFGSAILQLKRLKDIYIDILFQVEVLETGTTDPKKITKVTHIAFDDPAPRK